MSEPSLTVLLTSVWLDQRYGSEAVIRDIALGLLRRGHRPIVYSPHLGPPAEDLRERGVAIVSDLAAVAEPPDVIHGQHLIQTGEAVLHFPQTPAIQMCHAWAYWQERPAGLAQVRRYVAVDQAVRDRLAHTEGIDPARVEVLLNSVDLNRIPPRPAPLSERPARALAFTKTMAQLPLLAAACAAHGIELHVLGAGGERVAAPEHELVKFDLVFATARMALEAVCAGCAVVVCDSRGLAEMVTSENLDRLRPLNFGLRSLVHHVTQDRLEAEIARYDRADAEAVSARLRAEADFEPMLDRLIEIYREAIAQPPPDEAEQRTSMLRFLRQNLPRERTNPRWPWMVERQRLLARIDQLERELATRLPPEPPPAG